MRPVRIAGLVATLAMGAAAPDALAIAVPPWAQAQVSTPAPEHDARTAAVVLYSETALSIQPNGKIHLLERHVLKILRPEGLPYTVIRADSNSQVRTIRMHAWNIPSSGKPSDVDDRDAVESALIGVLYGNLMDDMRSKLLRVPAVVPGGIVASEVEQELQPYVLADDWVFQGPLAVREAHFSLELPAGWSYRARWINHPESAASTDGPRVLWTLTNLKPIRQEPLMPPWQAIAGRLAISLVPPDGHDQSFESWAEMGRWYSNLTRGRRDSSPQIKQRVAELTASQSTLLQKIQAIAAFVQSDVRYVAIELGIGGLQPHAANDVLMRGYGDCKDKSTLFAAMLKEIGVDAYYVVVNSQRGAISATTPPNLGFNHVIVAVRLPPEARDASLLSVSVHPKLGEIVFFDPTDSYMPFGSLAGPLQAGFGLLVTPDGGELVQLPVLPAIASAVQRTAHFTLDENGTLSGDVQDVTKGDMAALARRQVDLAPQETDRIKSIESMMANSFPTFQITKASIRSLSVHSQPFEWNYRIEVPNYGETSGPIVTLRPRVFGSKSPGFLETNEPRENDVEFEGPRKDTDLFEIALPAGYAVEELPAPFDEDHPYASYHSKTELVGHTLKYTRSFEIKQLTVSAALAPELRDFFRRILNEERQVAVLHRTAAR